MIGILVSISLAVELLLKWWNLGTYLGYFINCITLPLPMKPNDRFLRGSEKTLELSQPWINKMTTNGTVNCLDERRIVLPSVWRDNTEIR